MNIGRLDIIIVKRELEEKRKEFDRISVNMSLEEKLEWIRNFFNEYVPELEKRYMTEQELKEWIFLPDELRIWFYHYFPEHGLNMAKYTEQLMHDFHWEGHKRFQTVDRRFFSHYD
ncbi:MAG: hypothetical protein IKL68_02670 [Clostridia bacterium]|nr:hypothetical protein [Clostridia bacterium]